MFFIIFIILFLTASSIAVISINNSKNKSKDCSLKTPYTTECTNNKIKIIFPIDTPSSNNGKSCIDVASSLSSSSGYSNFIEINNKVEGSKDCRDCILSSPTVVPCDGTKVKLRYNITQSPINGGKDCMTVASSLPTSTGYTGFTQIDDKVEGSKDCRNCILSSSPTVVPCDGTKVKLRYNITQSPLNGGKDCLVVVPSLPSSAGYSNFTQIDDKVEGSKDCRNCILSSSPTVVPCDGTKVKLRYNITQTPLNGGKDCLVVVPSLPSSAGYSNFTQIDDKVEGSKDCRDCVLSSPTVVPCDGTKVKLRYNIIQTPLNGGKDCLVVVPSLPSSSGYSNFTQIDDKVEGSKDCRDCVLSSLPDVIPCDGTKVKLRYNITQTPLNGGKDCLVVVPSLPSSAGYSNFTQIDNKLEGSKDCKDCVLSSPTVIPCDGTKVKLQYNITQSPDNGGKDCMTLVSSLSSSTGYTGFTQIDNIVEGSKDCRDCQVVFSQQLDCQDYSEKRIYNISQDSFNGGNSCIDVVNRINTEINYDKFDISNNVVTFYKLCNLERIYGRRSLYYDIYKIINTKQNFSDVLTGNNNKFIVRFRDENGTTIGVNLPNDFLIYPNTNITSIDQNKVDYPPHEIPSAQSNDKIILYPSRSLAYIIWFQSDLIISYTYAGFLSTAGSPFVNYIYFSNVSKVV
jgi:hypothetical protein